MSAFDSPQIYPTPPRSIHPALLIVGAIVLSFISFVAGRVVERRTREVAAANDASLSSSAQREKVERMRAREDAKKFQEIADLNHERSVLGWELITPFKEFQAGLIDADTLRRRTAQPEVKILRLCTSMYRLASEVNDPNMREKLLNFTSATLRQQGGFSMMIEGIYLDDETRFAEGVKLFTDGRNDTLAAVVEMQGSDSPHTAHLNRLLDAYESSRH